MTYTIQAPNSSQSPALFPAQANVNFQRLKSITDADHFFLDTAGATQGFHRKVSFMNQASTLGSLGAANSIMYALGDISGASQLHFYNGANDFQLTPPQVFFGLRFGGSITLSNATPTIIFSNPGYEYSGTAMAFSTSGVYMCAYSVVRGVQAVKIASGPTLPTGQPTLSFIGNDLALKNNAGTPTAYKWSIILSRDS